MLEIRHYFSKYHTYLDNVMLLHVQYQLELPASIDAEVSKQQWPSRVPVASLWTPAKAKEHVRLMLNRTSL